MSATSRRNARRSSSRPCSGPSPSRSAGERRLNSGASAAFASGDKSGTVAAIRGPGTGWTYRRSASVQGQQEDVVPPSAVGRAVTAGQDGVHFQPRQVVDLSSWRALAGNREDAKRQVEGFRRAQRCEADERPYGGQTRIAGLNAVGAILFEVECLSSGRTTLEHRIQCRIVPRLFTAALSVWWRRKVLCR